MKDITGQQFGRLLVLWPAGFRNRTGKNLAWSCSCSCGKTSVAIGASLRTGHTQSCGCLRHEILRERSTIHGHGRQGQHSSTYVAWHNMRRRCSDPKNKDYRHYGGRGISVCPRWRDSFAAFLEDMGEKPAPDLSLDRINNDGNYEPSNCRWATQSEQLLNQRPRDERWFAERGTARCVDCGKFAKLSKGDRCHKCTDRWLATGEEP
jgi:hypothetical protein